MLIVQHIWSRWTKAARAAEAHRPRPKEAYVLPLPTDSADVMVHAVTMHEADAFELKQTFGPADGAMAGSVRWTRRPEGWGLSVLPPWEGMRVTGWPGHLPNPLSVLEPGQSVVIDWNGRFRNSMGGSNRGFFYEQHRIAAACIDGPPEPELFLTLEPRKTFDFTTKIY